MERARFTSKSESGKLPGINRNTWSYVLENLPDGKLYDIIIQDHVKDHTPAQRKYYRAVVLPYYLQGLIDAGHFREGQVTEQDLHDEFKRRKLRAYTKRIKNKVTGKYVVTAPSTKGLTTWQYMDFLDSLIQDAAETLSIAIPPPDPKWREKSEKDYLLALTKNLIHPDERNKAKIALSLHKYGYS